MQKSQTELTSVTIGKVTLRGRLNGVSDLWIEEQVPDEMQGHISSLSVNESPIIQSVFISGSNLALELRYPVNGIKNIWFRLEKHFD